MNNQGDSFTQSATAPDSQPWWITHKMQVISFSVLIALLLAVIFVLPNVVSPPVSQSATDNATAVTIPNGQAESPWSEAQKAKQRREAQGVLAEILKLQQRLEQQSVERWAGTEYTEAMDTAVAGDAFYRQHEFSRAQQQYRDSLAKFTAIVESEDVRFNTLVTEGAGAIAAGNSEQAKTAFELAGLIKAGHETARKGLQQADTLDSVLAHIEQAKLQIKAGNLNEGKNIVQQALSSDPDSSPAKELLTELNAAILERNFTAAMSEGFAALQHSQYAKAQSKFKHALSLKPQSNDAKTAINQAGNQQVQSNIKRLLADAAALESKEAWQEAESKYEQALAIDGSIVTARIGQIRSQTRKNLNSQFEQLLAKPERLASDAVYRQAQLIIKDAGGLTQTSAKLQGQVEQLSAILVKADTPVTVRLQSDELTDVTLYKIGQLGFFSKQEMELKPGKYVAVGKRDGYRDVRQEFTVSWDKPLVTVRIQCEERVASLR